MRLRGTKCMRNIGRLKRVVLLGVVILLAACGSDLAEVTTDEIDTTAQDVQEVSPTGVEVQEMEQAEESVEAGDEQVAFSLSSPAFTEAEPIPARFSCDGEDVSPALTWQGAPDGIVSYTLIMDDPDAPVGTWVHWVLYNIPGDVSVVEEAVPAKPILDDGSTHGSNSWGRNDYGGPCPPSGTHRYFFKLYALDTRLDLTEGADVEVVSEAMVGHILAETSLMGTFTR